MNHGKTYDVNGFGFDSFTAAIACARPVGANVVEVATGLQRWTPARPAKTRTRHVLVNADATRTEFGKVVR